MAILDDVNAAIPDFQALILEAGETVTLIKEPATYVNDTQPWFGRTPPADPDKTSFPAAILDPKEMDKEFDTIERCSAVALALAIDIGQLKPESADQLVRTVDGMEMTLAIIDVETYLIKNTAIAFEIYLAS